MIMRSSRKASLVAGVLALLTTSLMVEAKAQQTTLRDPLLEELIGTWLLSGTITGKQTTHDVHIRWALNHQFVEISEASREQNVDGSPRYEARAFLGWDSRNSRYVAYWMDTFGGGFSLVGYAVRDGDAIPIVFASDGGKFHTTFIFDRQTKTWLWAMDNEQNGTRKEFARLKMTHRPRRP